MIPFSFKLCASFISRLTKQSDACYMYFPQFDVYYTAFGAVSNPQFKVNGAELGYQRVPIRFTSLDADQSQVVNFFMTITFYEAESETYTYTSPSPKLGKMSKVNPFANLQVDSSSFKETGRPLSILLRYRKRDGNNSGRDLGFGSFGLFCF